MPKRKKKKTQLDLIKSVRRELPPSGKTIKSKKDETWRKRKHKKRLDLEPE